MKIPKKLKLVNQRPTIRVLDALIRQIVRLRDKVCRVCGSRDYLQVAHFITRSNHAIRWDLDNVYLLCSGCHTMRRTSWHKDPGGCAEWVRSTLGKVRYQTLRMRASIIGQKIDKSAVKLYLEQELSKHDR